MKPTLIEFPHISSYSFFMLLGFFAAWWLGRKRASVSGIDKRHVDNLILILLVIGPIGARLAARLFYMPQLSITDAFKVWQGGGLVFYGGFIAGIAAVLVYGHARKLSLPKLLDLLAPSAALGLAFGRVGCFLAGCCWGDLCLPAHQTAMLEPARQYQVRTVPALSPAFLGVTYPIKSDAFKQHSRLRIIDNSALRSAPVHAVQLYEAAVAVALAIWLHRRKPVFSGEIAIRLLIGYSVARFALEFFRADNQPLYQGMTFSQVTSLVILAVAILAVRMKARVTGASFHRSIPQPASART